MARRRSKGKGRRGGRGTAAAAAAAPAAARAGAGRPRLDARPDTLDFRDLMYVPTLTEVPLRIPLDDYRLARVPVLDQGKEGACTGFGLAAVVHYLLRTREVDPDAVAVSPRMLYEMARRHDEWPGEDYEGSSARGAMKGWHKHGVCSDAAWPYDPAAPDSALSGARSEDAVKRPLGAYFRVNHRDLVAMHAALAEVGILYATAAVHEGWWDPPSDGVVPFSERKTGGHAFAVVGYDERGFWVQNSWGTGWGKGGFGRVSYDDWLRNGSDVWVARLGVPVRLERADSVPAVRAAGAGGREAFAVRDLRPHVVSLGNDGRLRPEGTYGTSERDVEEIFRTEFPRITAGWKRRRILLYAHGGLVDEATAIQRLAEYRPTLLENGVYPVSFVWRSDFWSTVKNILEDAFRRRRPEGFLDAAKDFLLDRLDDALEPLARWIGGRAAWEEMKENALLATAGDRGGARVALREIAALLERDPSVEVHLAGHSAGSVFLAPVAQVIGTEGTVAAGPAKGAAGLGRRVATCTLWAPACTTRLYEESYHPLAVAGRAPGARTGIGDLAVFALTDRAERDDHCAGIYRKSLLYLVSHAFESPPRIPLFRPDGVGLLGMERFLGRDSAFGRLAAKGGATLVLSPNREDPATGRGSSARSHGAFDDDDATVRSTLVRVLGGAKEVGEIRFRRSAASMRERRQGWGVSAK